MEKKRERRRSIRRRSLGRRANDIVYTPPLSKRNHFAFAAILMLVLVVTEFFISEGIVKWVDKGVDALVAAWTARIFFGD